MSGPDTVIRRAEVGSGSYRRAALRLILVLRVEAEGHEPIATRLMSVPRIGCARRKRGCG
eukprot:3876336-Rhodomonas_salina.1